MLITISVNLSISISEERKNRCIRLPLFCHSAERGLE